MKKILIIAAALAVVTAAQAQENAHKPPVETPVEGKHCDLPAGELPIPVINYDAKGRTMRCVAAAPVRDALLVGNGGGTWRYVMESESVRIEQKLDQLNVTNVQILQKLTEIQMQQQASARK